MAGELKGKPKLTNFSTFEYNIRYAILSRINKKWKEVEDAKFDSIKANFKKQEKYYDSLLAHNKRKEEIAKNKNLGIQDFAYDLIQDKSATPIQKFLSYAGVTIGLPIASTWLVEEFPELKMVLEGSDSTDSPSEENVANSQGVPPTIDNSNSGALRELFLSLDVQNMDYESVKKELEGIGLNVSDFTGKRIFKKLQNAHQTMLDNQVLPDFEEVENVVNQ